jgi:hypothetical protein
MLQKVSSLTIDIALIPTSAVLDPGENFREKWMFFNRIMTRSLLFLDATAPALPVAQRVLHPYHFENNSINFFHPRQTFFFSSHFPFKF